MGSFPQALGKFRTRHSVHHRVLAYGGEIRCADSIPPCLLPFVHPGVRRPEHLSHASAPDVIIETYGHGHSETRMNAVPWVLLDSTADSLARQERAVKRGICKGNDELLATVPCAEVGLADSGLNDTRHLTKHFISRGMREAIVDVFEVVKVPNR